MAETPTEDQTACADHSGSISIVTRPSTSKEKEQTDEMLKISDSEPQATDAGKDQKKIDSKRKVSYKVFDYKIILKFYYNSFILSRSKNPREWLTKPEF